VVRRGAVKGLGLKDAPTSPEREFKTLHRTDARPRSQVALCIL
jgi:hypothetical protein